MAGQIALSNVLLIGGRNEEEASRLENQFIHQLKMRACEFAFVSQDEAPDVKLQTGKAQIKVCILGTSSDEQHVAW